MSRIRSRAAALSFAVAGVLFVLYPAIRPFSAESSLNGAAAFGSTAWIVAHAMAIVAFVLLVLGLLGAYLRVQQTAGDGFALAGLVLCWIGVGLTLPFYGAEVFGLHAIGQEALAKKDVALVGLASSVRGEPGIWFIVSGLLILEAGIVVFAIGVWRSAVLTRWLGIPLAVGFALYLPQYMAPQWLRVAHGLLITLSCALLAWTLWRTVEQRESLRRPD